jgi:NTE family protein
MSRAGWTCPAARAGRAALAALALVGPLLGLVACQTPPSAPQSASCPCNSEPLTPRQIERAVGAQQARAPTPAPKPRLGLALGGGAARGFAHIGVIQVLESAGIRPDLVVGTSAGSLVAALWAAGKTGAELEALALTLDESELTDWSLPNRGVLQGDALARWVRQQTGGKPIEQMKHPLGIVATELATGQPILFRQGDTGLAVRASSAVPAVFQPVRIQDREYVDGGLVAPIPVHMARRMGATLVIAVDISMPPEHGRTAGTMDMLLQTFAIMGRSIGRYELGEADLVLKPNLTGLPGTDFSNRVRAIRAGREAATAMLPTLRQKLGLPAGG